MDKDIENSLKDSIESTNTEQDEITNDKEGTVEKEETIDKEAEAVNDSKDANFIQLFIANFADVTAISALTFIGIFIFKLILKVAGWRLKSGTDIIVYLVGFIIVSLLYAPIITKTKLRATIGQKLFYLRLRKED